MSIYRREKKESVVKRTTLSSAQQTAQRSLVRKVALQTKEEKKETKHEKKSKYAVVDIQTTFVVSSRQLGGMPCTIQGTMAAVTAPPSTCPAMPTVTFSGVGFWGGGACFRGIIAPSRSACAGGGQADSGVGVGVGLGVRARRLAPPLDCRLSQRRAVTNMSHPVGCVVMT
ncbi:hypothetical protein BD289DRAFT_266319 [Coniella lustricola]|uniref:Uncharacterized protein n=1 Tax=Coniella lustricola TaxID=2025994 RepID=A0A2T3A796_9PEZI|nr:hypothetical protein BD289DRAFT_266319 [Coniella lustricola]